MSANDHDPPKLHDLPWEATLVSGPRNQVILSGAIRELTDHRQDSGSMNDCIAIGVLDEPGAGGASTRYVVFLPHDHFNQELNAAWAQYITFQCGDPKDQINGLTNEALLAIVADRLRGFQSGSAACWYNDTALSMVLSAITLLHERTRERFVRGVESTPTP
jgi:hypothetical protein